MINTKKIKGRLAELGLTQRDVAQVLDIAQPTANQKINNIRPMDLDEAKKLAILLDLKVEEFQTYFFYPTVALRNFKFKGEVIQWQQYQKC